jgi:hypothetical protein
MGLWLAQLASVVWLVLVVKEVHPAFGTSIWPPFFTTLFVGLVNTSKHLDRFLDLRLLGVALERPVAENRVRFRFRRPDLGREAQTLTARRRDEAVAVAEAEDAESGTTEQTRW